MLAVKVPRGTRFVLIGPSGDEPYDIDLTQGEVVVPPCELVRTQEAAQTTRTCKPFSHDLEGDVMDVTILPMHVCA